MNEEMNRLEAELSEAELTNVSGGASDSLVEIVKKDVCMCCPHFGSDCRDRCRELADYMMRNGYINYWVNCPLLPK